MAAMLSRNGEFRDSDLMKRTVTALNEQRNESRFCDVVLRVCNTEIYAHSNVLAAASPYFSSFLGTGPDIPRTFCQKQPQIIEIHIDSVLLIEGDGGYGEAVSRVVDYMYTSEIALTTTLVSQIIVIGKIMLLDKLLEFCNDFQKGLNDNRPQNVSTCTSGLQEVVDLLNRRSKIIKRSSVATETDEALFAKIRRLSPVSFDDNVPVSGISRPSVYSMEDMQDIAKSKSLSIDSDTERITIPEVIIEEKESPVTSHMTDPPSLFDTLEPPTCRAIVELDHGDETIKSAPQNSVVEPSRATTSDPNETIKNSDVDASGESLQNLDGMESLADILNVVPFQKDFASDPEIFEIPEKRENNETKLTETSLSQDIQIVSLKDTKPAVPVSVHASKVVDPVASSKSSGLRKRGRPRGRGRGRRRGRPPGRPKKIKDPESDPEFDEFMKSIESGDMVEEGDEKKDTEKALGGAVQEEGAGYLSSVISNEIPSKKEDPDYNVPLNVKRDLLSSTQELSSMWKSPRVRSQPSQLKKDYVLHSLSRKSRKSQGVSVNQLKPVNMQSSNNSSGPSGKKSKSLRFLCQKCDFSTFIFRDYRQHMRSHPETDPRYFVCHKCDFKTTKSREYTSHKRMHMVQDFICVYCDFQASTQPEYEEHNEKHSGEYPYFCTECNSRFKKKNQLMSHKTKHQLFKPFICTVCKAGFKWKHALKNHMITHNPSKDHLCDVCGYATAHKSQLKAHKLVHTGQTFKCSIPGCEFEATKRQKLKYHMVTHTHEKPHQCDVCGQRFSLNKNMRRHMLLHTNIRPYACKMCSFTTTRYDKLKEHNFKVHGIGEPTVSKKPPIPEFVEADVTYVKSENLTLNTDGTLSTEALQTIAQLAASQQEGTPDLNGQQATINIEQPVGDAADATNFPIVARIQYAQVEPDGTLQLLEWQNS